MGRSSTTRVVDNVGSGPRPMNQALISGIGGPTDDPVNEHTHFATWLRGGQLFGKLENTPANVCASLTVPVW